MKTQVSLGWVWGILLAGGAVAAGLAQDGLNSAQTVLPSPGTAATAPASAAAAVPQTTPPPATAAPTGPGDATDKSAPSNRPLSPWFYEIERLTQAGIDDEVILSYINNSAGTFSLTAEQVIALKTLGTSPRVLNAMLEHDRELITGERPMTASAPPPLPPSVQAAFAASFHATAPGNVPPATVVNPLPPPTTSIVAPDDEPGAEVTWVSVEPGDAPEQPASAGPVRLPYPVKLNDPIIVLRLPTFTVPYW